MWDVGAAWSGEQFATAVAFGQVDNNPEAELGLTRRTDQGPRAWVFSRGWAASLPFVAGAPVEE